MLSDGNPWFAIKDGDDRALALWWRHYSRYVYKDGRKPRRFVGPGERSVLLTLDYDALFVWRKFIDKSGQQGVNCAVFHNEGKYLSSWLIKQAENLAWVRWPGQRLYTYVSAEKTAKRRGKNNPPGYCFIMAGWQPCGISKARKLLIFEKYPPVVAEMGAAA